jgi:uncharacterized membrane protein
MAQIDSHPAPQLAPPIGVSPAPDNGRVYMNAILHPHRSLPPLGFFLVMALVGGISFTAGLLFYLQGAWPVMGFFGLDVLLVWLAFRFNYRSGRMYETVRLTDEALSITHVDEKGRQRQFTLEPYWLRVTIDMQGRREQLVLSSHGRRFLLGPFLTGEERKDFAKALKAALARRRAALEGGAL